MGRTSRQDFRKKKKFWQKKVKRESQNKTETQGDDSYDTLNTNQVDNYRYDSYDEYNNYDNYHNYDDESISQSRGENSSENVRNSHPPASYPLEQEYEIDLDHDHLQMTRDELNDNYLEKRSQRTKYHPRMDRFLNNGILLVGVLLLLVLVIAFLL